jgi:hypothetical protein
MTVPMVLAPPRTHERILGLPRSVLLATIIPIGYPLGQFGSVSRHPAESMIPWDRYQK